MSEIKLLNVEEKKDGTMVLTQGQDVSSIWEDNYELRKHTKQIWRSKKDSPVGEFVGRIPILILEDWIAKGFVHVNGCACGCTPQMRRKMLFAMLNLHPENKVTDKTL